MELTAQLWLFFLIVLGVVLLPGLDMACVLATSLGGGRRAGFAAVGGIVAGGVVHVAVGATGIALVLVAAPALFNLVLAAGAAYVAWIGISLVRHGIGFDPGAADARGLEATAFRRGAMTNLLNPKAYAFMLAIFPQFVRPDLGPVGRQAAVLGAIIAVTQAGVYGALVLGASRLRAGLAGRPAPLALLGRAVGLLLVGAALWTLLAAWRPAAASIGALPVS